MNKYLRCILPFSPGYLYLYLIIIIIIFISQSIIENVYTKYLIKTVDYKYVYIYFLQNKITIYTYIITYHTR